MSFAKTVKLNTGATIPLIGFGTAFCTEAEADTFMLALEAALVDAGCRHIDGAWFYDTEHLIGKVVGRLLKDGKLKRDDLFITSKVWPCFWNDPETSLAETLADLQVDYLDLYIQHWPACFKKEEDPNTEKRVGIPRDSNGDVIMDSNGDYLTTYKKMLALKESTGQIKAVGVSNYSVEMLERLIQETGTVPAVNQIELHPLFPQLELYDYCKSKGIVVEAYSPFGSMGAPNLHDTFIVSLAEKYNVSSADIIINYFIKKEIVCLPRSQNTERIRKGFPLVEITDSDINLMDEYGTKNSKRYINAEWGYWNSNK